MRRAGVRMAAAAASVALAVPNALAAADEPPASASGARRDAAGPVKPPVRPARQPRLSDWLLQQKPSPDDYPLGLSWRVPEEVAGQTLLKLGLVTALVPGQAGVSADPAAIKRLRDWISGLAVTGRVPVASADGRWLQVNPSRDPVLANGHGLVMPRRPRTLTVVGSDGTRCAVVHQASREARAYLDACSRSAVDWAWIAQPDGRVQRVGVALWNREHQDEPAAGAWIWAPARGGGWDDAFSERLIRFLATQGPAPDPGTAPAPADPIETRAALHDAPAAQGATAPVAEGIVLGGGMSLGLSEAMLAAHDPAPGDAPRAPVPEPAPVILRNEAREPRSRDLPVSSSDWGTIGLLQTPTARMRETGQLSFHYSYIQPYGRGNVIFQPLEWLEGGFRYTNVNNRPYGPVELSGDQNYKDKSFDIKLRAWKESAYIPQIAVGLRDVGGTGFFSGEYVVANKRTGDFDWSLGLGWGYIGGRADIRNPLRVFGNSFDTRGTSNPGTDTGKLSLSTYFHGPTALFGGVQYHTPWDPLTVKVEYDGNDYQNEPQANNQRQRSPINVGLVYKAAKGVDLTLAYERGDKVMFGVTLYTDLARLGQPKVSDPRPVPVVEARPAKAPDWSKTAQEVATQTDWRVRSIERTGNEVRVVFDDADAAYWRYRVDRGAAVLHRDAPPSVDLFKFSYRNSGADIAEHVIDRDAWVAERVHPLPPSQQREAIVAQTPQPSAAAGDVVHQGRGRDLFEHGLRLSYGQVVGGPDAFILWQLGLVEDLRLNLRPDTWLAASVRLRIADNYDKFKYTAPSDLPRVRTFQREYLTTSNITMPTLYAAHVGRAGEGHYFSAYAGYLEDMFGGAGGEWLYRPFGSRFAFGADANAVRQRDFNQHFGFRDYDVLTGHGTVYWDTGWNDVLAQVSVGRYLAKDYGATVQLSKVFRNGVTLGAFATRTNVSSAEFGEGSFDKGIWLSIPFDALFTRTSRASIYTLWRPLTRDGGAMLYRPVQLYNVTSARSDRTLWYAPAAQPDEKLNVVDRKVANPPPPKTSVLEPYTRVTPKPPAQAWERPGSLDQHRLVEDLYAQGYRNIRVEYDTSERVVIAASHSDLKPIGRAVGRAARTALLKAPLSARGIELTISSGATVQAGYDFFNLEVLRRYFEGEVGAETLMPYVKIDWINPAARVRDPLRGLDDLDPQASPEIIGAVVPETFSVSRVANDYAAAAKTATQVDWLRATAIGAGLVFTSSVLDNRGLRFANKHAGNTSFDRFVDVGNAIPFVALGAAGLAAIDGSDPRRSRTGYAAFEAGAAGFGLATGMKYVFGRARPSTGLNHTTFEWGTREDSLQSFPSRHSVVAWSVATPFALEYDMPWLYALPAVTNLARIGSREHWVSDTVASSLIGYGLGRIFWQSSRDQRKGDPRVFFDGSSLSLLWPWSP